MKQMLNVVNTNWGLKRAGDWDFTEFSLLPCGDLSIRVFYSRPLEDFEDVDVDMLFPIPVVDTMLQIKEKDLHRIKERGYSLHLWFANPSAYVTLSALQSRFRRVKCLWTGRCHRTKEMDPKGF